MRILKLRLSITAFILAIASSLWAQTPVTVTSTFTDKYGNVGNGEDKWSITYANGDDTETSTSFDNSKGLRFNHGHGMWILTSERYYTSISCISILASVSKSNNTVYVDIRMNGDTQLNPPYIAVNKTSNSTFSYNYTSAPPSGTLALNVQSLPYDFDFYIKSISVTYTPTENEAKVMLDEAIDNTPTLTDNDLSTSETVTVDLYRALTADMWNAICLPFSMSTPQQTALFGEGYKLKEFTSVDDEDGTSLKFTTVKGSTVAGKPYIVLPTQSVARNDKVSIRGVAITNRTPGVTSVTSVTGTQGTYTYEGIYAPTVLELNNQKIRFIGSGNKLYYPTTSNPMRAFRCFFTLPSDNAASNVTLNIDDDGVATAISATEVQGLFSGTNKVYTITGQYVGNNVPQEKGIYLIDGKKIQVR